MYQPASIRVENWCAQPRDPRAFLWDVAEAAHAIEIFTMGMNAQFYADSALVNAAVERKFQIIGEALNQLSKSVAAMAARSPEVSKSWPLEIS